MTGNLLVLVLFISFDLFFAYVLMFIMELNIGLVTVNIDITLCLNSLSFVLTVSINIFQVSK